MIDLGTYHVRVEMEGGEGFIYQWDTGARYAGGVPGLSPLTAQRIPPTGRSEDDLASGVEFVFGSDGNSGCDCNLRNYLDQSRGMSGLREYPCGDSIVITALTLIRPDGSERALEIRR